MIHVTHRGLALALVAVLGASMLGDDCDGDIVQDPTFRDWCGASLCSWQTVSGKIERVPTWDKHDFGVSFLDNGAAGTTIVQVTPENQATCVLFTSVGDIDPQAGMEVDADFDSDGTIDYIAPLGSASWHRVQAEIAAPLSYVGITFYVRKKGTGTAILAEMAIQSTTGCSAATAPPLADLRLGEACGSVATCAEGLVCPEPVDGGLRLCAQCSAESPCADGVACQQKSVFLPFQCGPGQGLGQTGAPCIARDDCASGACKGASPVGLLSGDAAPCDLDSIGPGDTTNCQWDSALGGTCQ